MSKIKFVSLGGLGETGKNLYLLDIDSSIFVLDCGLKEASNDLYGVDSVIPDVKYLFENKDRVKAIFVSHGHDDNIGAIVAILKFLNVGVFGSHFTISLIEDALKEEGMDVAKFKLYRINETKELSFGSVNVGAFSVAHSIPETLNYVFRTKDGNIYYCPDFTFDVNKNSKYYTSLNKISSFTASPTLLCLSESMGALNYNRVNNDTALDYLLDDLMKEEKRLIFTAYSEELSRIQKIIDIAISRKKKVAIIGLKAQKIIAKAIENGYLEIPEGSLVNLKYIDDINGKKKTAKNDSSRLVVIVTGAKHKPFYTLQRMARGDDRLINLTSNDHVVIMSPVTSQNERCATVAKDEVFRVGAKYTEITKDILRSTHADGEDLKMLYSIINPKYIIPIEGEDENLYASKKIARDAGFEESKVLILENGQVALFEDGILKSTNERIRAKELLVDGSILDVNTNDIVKTREQVAQDGLVLINMAIDKEKLLIKSLPDVILKGIGEKNTDELKEKIISCTISEIQVQFNRHKFVDFDYMTDRLEKTIEVEVKNETKKRPKVIINFVNF